MKCPKCGYLGFETVDRCRNCGYDFSLSTDLQASSELPLRTEEPDDGPLDLTIQRNTPSTPALDLDRVIGEAEPPSLPVPGGDLRPSQRPPSPPAGTEVARGDGGRREGRRSSGGTEVTRPPASDARVDDAPLISAPRPARPPLAVRRSTPEVPRGRSRTTPRPMRRDEPTLALELDAPAEEPTRGATPPAAPATATPVVAGIFARLIAGIVDLGLLLAINVAVLYFTLAITGLSIVDLGIIPPIPMVAFLMMLNGGYLIAFTAASGQTIGKMLTGIRVEGDDGRRIDVAGAVLRAGGFALSLLTLGIGFLPALFGRRRALHDRLAGTQVVAVR